MEAFICLDKRNSYFYGVGEILFFGGGSVSLTLLTEPAVSI